MLLYLTLLCASAVFFFRGSRTPTPGVHFDASEPGLRQWEGWEGISNMFVFGGAYTTTRFQVDDNQPNPANPFGNPEDAGYDANGPQWVRFMTANHNKTFIRTYNLARNKAAPFKTLKDQVDRLWVPKYDLSPDVDSWKPYNTLFAIALGVNDIALSEVEKYKNMDDEVETMQSYNTSINTLYNHGARNFVLINTPPIDRSPAVLALDPDRPLMESIAYRVFDTNQRTRVFATDFALAHEDATIFYFDLNVLYEDILDFPPAHPATQDIKNTTDFCPQYASGTDSWDSFIEACNLPVNEYFWLDGFHPTYPIHNATAQEVVKLLESNRYIQW